MSELITVNHKGSQMLATNYFQSKLAAAGQPYLYWSPGFGRLLIPDSKLCDVNELKNCEHVVISRGQMQDVDCVEIMFEDSTSTPNAYHLMMNAVSRELPAIDNGSEFIFQAIGSDGKEFECKGVYRVVDELPCLLPLND